MGGAILTGPIARAQVQTAGPRSSGEQVTDKPIANATVKDEAADLPGVLKPVVQPDGEPTLKDLIEQLAEQYRPYALSELHLLRAVCGLTNEQCKPIARAARRLLDETARADATITHDGQKKKIQGVPPKPEPARPTPASGWSRGLINIVKTRLTPEQSGHYQDEVRKRNDYRKEVGIRGLVARLDSLLILTADQRDRLCTSFAANWRDAWGTFAILDDSERFPKIPDRYITPLLSPAQRKAWDDIEKTEVGPSSDRVNLAAQLMSVVPSDFAADLGKLNNQQAIVPAPAAIPDAVIDRRSGDGEEWE